MFNLELTVQDGDYEGRKAWTLVMLFDGALYSISQMIKALGVEVKEVGDRAEFQIDGYPPNVVPGPEFWQGKQFVIRTKVMPARKVKDKRTGEMKEYDARTEVKGFMSPKDWNPDSAPKKATASATGSKPRVSLLP
jgi:hypothetical protein